MFTRAGRKSLLVWTVLRKNMSSTVNTLQGIVRGCDGVDLDGNKFHQFLGIPFAKAPMGELRFKDPQPPESWEGIRDATQEGNPCFHESELSHKPIGSEDCLSLNIFTRGLPTDTTNLKPVMVFIHGGSFRTGSNSRTLYGPEFLISEDVVLVTINFRLGLLGHLQAPNLGIYGNMGLKDQVAALKWVKNNIIKFNGDPKNVTLFGESSGGASVHYHVLSQMSRGLFHKAIIQSGAALNPWADQTGHNPIGIAKFGDKNISTEEQAIEYLKSQPVETLYEIQNKYRRSIQEGEMWPYGVAIDTASPNPFMPRRPIDIITSGEYNKMPIIFGYNSREGIYFNQLMNLAGVPQYSLGRLIPYNVVEKGDVNLKKSIIETFKNVYYQGGNEDDNFISLIGDIWFNNGVIGSVINHVKNSPYPIYMYRMTLDTKLNLMKVLCKLQKIPGCTHGDDLGYLFKNLLNLSIEPDSIEDISLRRVIKLWTNFARYSNPTPDLQELGVIWEPVNKDQLNALNIGEKLEIEIVPENKKLKVWKEIYSKSLNTINYL